MNQHQIKHPTVSLWTHRLLGLLLIACYGGLAFAAEDASPNIVIIFCDDLGYGDIGCFGHPTIQTPNIDKMATEGMKFTQFYAAAPVCTPSRSALMTGRLPIRTGMCSDKRRVLFPNSGGGIQQSEITLAEGLQKQGYKTACIGKWHLGHLPQFMPNQNGFDHYFGVPYSNDMDGVFDRKDRKAVYANPLPKYWNLPLLRNNKIIERPTNQNTLTKRYTEEAVQFITKNQKKKFFVYLPHSMPHIPLFRSKEFQNHSARGLFGDVIEELDWSVGQILDTLRNLKLDKKTLVFFTSDNGPWLIMKLQGGSAGLLRDGKGSTWEGGMREPTIAWGPGRIPAGKVSQEVCSTMDLYTTSLKLAGADVPTDRIVDGVDIRPVLFGTGSSPRKILCYYRGTKLMAIRKGAYKAHFITKNAYGRDPFKKHDPPMLFNLEHDPSEKYNIAKDHPKIVKEILADAAEHQKSVKPVPSQLEIPLVKK